MVNFSMKGLHGALESLDSRLDLDCESSEIRGSLMKMSNSCSNAGSGGKS